MFPTSVAGSLPKPGWLAETNKLWPQWRLEGEPLRQAKADATLLWIKLQEDAGLAIVTDNIDWKQGLGQEWRQYEQIFPALAASSIGQVSLECFHSHVPPQLMKLLEGKDVLVGVIDVASDEVETPEQVAETIGTALQFVPKHRLFPCTNCGLAPMDREVAVRKLEALARGAELARRRFG